MGDLFTAGDASIVILRLVALAATAIILALIARNELAGLARHGRGWISQQAELCRTKTGYVAAVLGRSSTLMGACTLVFAVFRPAYFTAEAARDIATLLSSIAVLSGCFVALTVFGIAGEIVRQSKPGE